MLRAHVGVVEPRWAPRSSKPLRGAAEVALVGSTPIHSRGSPLHVPGHQRFLEGACDQEGAHVDGGHTGVGIHFDALHRSIQQVPAGGALRLLKAVSALALRRDGLGAGAHDGLADVDQGAVADGRVHGGSNPKATYASPEMRM